MSFLPQRVLRLQTLPFRTLRRNGAEIHWNVASKRASSSSISGGKSGNSEFNEQAVPPLFTQTPPAWVRYAWPIIIANGLLMGSAVDLTWNHWARLVSDLEEIGEKNRAVAAASSSSTSLEVKQEDKRQEAVHWERHPTWLRTIFCGLYGVGWAFSTAYLLKYRQTFVTKLRFFRAPPLSLTQNPSSSTSTSRLPERKLDRFIHISTAASSSGNSLCLNELTLQDGRNETELVIRYKDVPSAGKGAPRRKKRDYWYISLTDAWVQGSKMGDVVSARDNIIWAWDGDKGNGGVLLTSEGNNESGRVKQETKMKKQPSWRNGPVLKK